MKAPFRGFRWRGLAIGLPLFLIANAFSQSSNTFLLKVAGDGDPKTIASKALQGAAKIEGRHAKSGAFIVRLNPGHDLTATLDRLRRRRDVSEAFVPGTDSGALRFDSLKQIREFIEDKEKGLEGDEKENEEEREKLGLDYLESWEYRLRIRAYPYDKIDWDAYDKARRRANNMPHAKIGISTNSKAKAAAPVAGQWEFMGPSNLDVPYRIYYGVRPTSGRVNSLAYDPKNPSTIYLGAANGGVWKSVDGGAKWSPLADDWDFLYVSSVAVDPVNTQIVYAGTGDWHGFGSYGIGMMKSTDGGKTWTNLGRALLSGVAISKVLVDPENTSIITITTGRGSDFNGRVYRSTDGGQNFTPVITTAAPWSDATISARTSSGTRYYYAVGGGDGGNVWRSSDRGATWTKLTANVGSGNLNNLGVAASLSSPERAYILGADSGHIYKTTDHGDNWTDVTGNFPGGYNWSQSWYDFHITCGTAGGNDAVYVGLIDIVQSLDSGSTWQSIGNSYTNSAITHNDQHSMAVNPANPSEAVFGNDGGVYKLTTSGTSTTITPLSKTLGISQFYYADWHPTNSTIAIGGTQDNATPTSLGDLSNWRNVGGGDGGWALINPQKTSTQYATSQYLGMYRTDNSWATSRSIAPNTGTDNLAFIPTIAIDPITPNNVYAATNYLWRYNAGSDNWSPRLGNTALSRGYILTITVAPSNSKVIYTGGTDGELYVTTNSGTSWRRLNGLPNRSITGISVDPANENSILVTVGGTGTAHVYLCPNTSSSNPSFVSRNGVGGVSLPDIHTNTIERDPSRPTMIWYVGTDIGVFATTDGGTSWANATTPLGLPNVTITALKAIPGTGYLNAATHGRGMWRIKLGSESNLGPDSYAKHFGTVTSGNLSSLAKADGNVMTVRSAYLSGIGQTAGIQASFTSQVTKANTLGVELYVRSSGESIATEQVYIKNQTTGQFENLKNEASSTSLRDFRHALSGSGADYIADNGKIEVVVRTLKPTRLGSTPITYKIDCINVIIRSSG